MMLHEIVSGIERPVPERVYATDVAVDILTFAVTSFKGKGTAAIATLVEIRGGAAKALGSHMAIASDGRYCGYVSGGCVEASVAAEALIAMEERRDRQISFGEGSP